MDHSFWICTLVLLHVAATKFIFPVRGLTSIYDYRVRDPDIKRIQKRGIYYQTVRLGAEALDQLLRQTKLLYTNGYDKVLIKGGGYRQAISDFNSVHPDVTRRNSKQGEMVGSKGNLILTLTKKGGTPKLSIEWQKLYHTQFLDPSMTFTIIYKTKRVKG